MSYSSRKFFKFAGASAILGARGALPAAEPQQPLQPRATPNLQPWVNQPQPYPYCGGRSTVSLVKGESRRKNITDALVASQTVRRVRLPKDPGWERRAS